MGVNVFAGTFAAVSGSGSGATQNITGLPFRPVAVIFFGFGQESATDAINTQDIRPFFGAATGASTLNKGFGGWTGNALATSDSASRQASNRAITVVNAAATSAVVLEVTAFNSDGFTVTYRATASANTQISYLAIGGADITNVAAGSFSSGATTGNEGETGFGFQPDLVFLFTNFNTVDNYTAHNRLGIGAGDGVNQWVFSVEDRDAQATTVSNRYGKSGEIVAHISVGSMIRRASLASLDADGITLNWLETTGAITINYLAIKGGGIKVGTLTTQTDTSTAITQSGLGFNPRGALFVSVARAENTVDTSANEFVLTIGAASNDGSQVAQAVEDKHNVADSVTATAIDYDQVYVAISTAQAVEGAMAVTTWAGDSLTEKMTDADPTAKFVGYVILGEKLAPWVSDAVAVAESVTVVVSSGVTDPQVNKSDTVGVSEGVTVAPLLLRVGVSDTVAVSESVVVSPLALTRSVSDTVGTAESVAVTPLTVARAVSDAVGVSDTPVVVLSLALAINVSESVGVSENIALARPALAVSVNDNTTVAENPLVQVSVVGLIQIAVSDGVGVTDTATTLLPWLLVVKSDPVGVAESVALARAALAVSVTDAVGVAEAVSLSVSALGVVNINVSDAVGVTDVAALSLAIPGVNVQDALTVTDSPVVSGLVGRVVVSDVVGVAEQLAILSVLNVSRSDTVNVAESLAEQLFIGLLTSDNVSVTDQPGIVIPGGLLVGVTDVVFVTDTAALNVSIFNVAYTHRFTVARSASMDVGEDIRTTFQAKGLRANMTIGEKSGLATSGESDTMTAED